MQAESQTVTVKLPRERECVHSVRFLTKDPKAPVSNVYVSRDVPWAATAKEVTLTITPGAS